jgi:hypothetical protein
MPGGFSYAKYEISPPPTITRPVPAETRLSTWHYPMDDDSRRCLYELQDILNDSQRWGLLIDQGFSMNKLIGSMFITIGVCVVVGMVADDLGRTVGGTLRVSFLTFLGFVVFFGLLPHPGNMDVLRDKLGPRKFVFWGIVMLGGVVSQVCEHMMGDVLRRAFNAFLIISLLVGLLPHPLLRACVRATLHIPLALVRLWPFGLEQVRI